MREIKFVIHDKDRGICNINTVDKPTDGRGAYNFRGFEVSAGYILRKVKGHPYANSRGYYLEHRLVVESSLLRFLQKDEVVHHLDGNRKNNDLSNLKIITQSEHAGIEMRGIRNPNGTMIASEPIFNEIKFRLHDIDRGTTRIYTLSQLIGTTFRRGKFQFRGRWTGLTDKNGKEIYEGDITNYGVIEFKFGKWLIVNKQNDRKTLVLYDAINDLMEVKIIGNIYESPELITNSQGE